MDARHRMHGSIPGLEPRLARAPREAFDLEADVAWWSLPEPALFEALRSAPSGLAAGEAAARLARHGAAEVVVERTAGPWRLWWRQFTSPLVLILVGASVLSLLLRDWTDAVTLLVIIGLSALLGFWQEWRASEAVARLRRRLALTARAWRDGQVVEIPSAELVPGDVVELEAGSRVPGDGRVIAARHCQVDQASLTGESLPVDKSPGTVEAATPAAARHNCVHLGSSLRSGSARVLLVRTGRGSLLAEVASRLAAPEAETDFERGVRRFGQLLLRVMLAVVVLVLAANAMLGRPPVESLLFAVALAVGLSPELLPAIVSVSLARGARRLAAGGVLVRRLDAIEDLGGMDVLCTDKTGTLTIGEMALVAAVDPQGQPSDEVRRLAFLNATLGSGVANPIDTALAAAARESGWSSRGWQRIDELPYDFQRRRMSVVVAAEAGPGQHWLVTKGAVAEVLDCCDLREGERERVMAWVAEQGRHGVRVLAVAQRGVAARGDWRVEDERAMSLQGLVGFRDPLKPDAARMVAALHRLGVRVKLVTGDNRHVAAEIAAQVGLDPGALLTGPAVAAMGDEALWHQAGQAELFVEVDPTQKERIVRALQRTGHAVGFLGDGINDAPSLHAADVGISVSQAVDVARESADIVLLRHDLGVLERGIAEGRRTFANTLKYIRITLSANFGNMISMALATPLLPFLPLTATQILLNNLLSDLPALALAADRVEPQGLRRAPRWDLAQVRRFMIVFGLVSSVFDLLTFAVLLHVFHAGPELFRSAWFVVSLLTELAVLLILRTRGPCWRGQPSALLAWTTAAVALFALALPWITPLHAVFGFTPLPPALLGALVVIVLAYALATEAAKAAFWRSGTG